jgi:hypothetical protein
MSADAPTNHLGITLLVAGVGRDVGLKAQWPPIREYKTLSGAVCALR